MRYWALCVGVGLLCVSSVSLAETPAQGPVIRGGGAGSCANIAGGGGSTWNACDGVGTSNGAPTGGVCTFGQPSGTGAGIGDAQTLTGGGDSFDVAALVFVNNAQVIGVGTQTVNSYAIAPSAAGGLTRNLRYDILQTESTARVVFTLTNTTAAPISATVNYAGNFGSDGATVVNGTFSGDNLFTTADEWMVTSDGVDGDPVNTTVFFGGVEPPSVLPTSASQTSFGCNAAELAYNVGFNPTVPANGALTFIFFQRLSDTAAGAVTAAADFTNIQASSPLLAGLSAAELAQLANFDVTLSPQPPADTNPRKQGGFIANAGMNCRGATPGDDQAFITSADGMRNSSGVPRVLACNQVADEFARSSGNGTPNTAGIASFSIVFRNFDTVAVQINCNGTAGRAGGPQFSLNKTVIVVPGGRGPINWLASTDNGGVPFQRPTNIVCTVPNNIQVNENYNRFFREVGDF